MALSVSAIEKLDASWMKNATRLWNIPLHPSGEMDVYDILEDISKRTDILQDQLKGIWMQLVIHLIIGYIHLRNTNIAFKMVIAQPRSLVRWCCLIPSLLGIALPIYTATFYFAKGISCRILFWYGGFDISVSLICFSMILLRKAYVILNRQRWVVVAGIILVIPQTAIPAILIASTTPILSIENGCILLYPPYLAWYWFIITILANAFFSGIFSYTAYRQYRMFGSETWKRLAKDGIQSMCFVILCNVICSAVLCFKLAGNISATFFIFDCVISSTVLIESCRKTRNALNLSNRPNTAKLLHLSEIPTTMYREDNIAD